MPNLSLWATQLDIGTIGDRFELQVTALKNGAFVAVWSESTFSGVDVVAQIYNADGTILRNSFKVNSTDIGPTNQRSPDVTALADGGFAVAWVDYTNDATGADVRARVFGANGAAKDNDFIATKTVSGNQISPYITAYGDGFIVSAVGYQGSTGVSNTVFDAAGNSTEVGLAGNYESHSASAIIDAPEGSRYAGMFISAALDPVSAKITVRATLNNTIQDTWDIVTSASARSVCVTALSNGRFLVSWKQTDASQSSPDKVKGIIYEADGDSSAVLEFASAILEIKNPVVAALPDGGFALAYEKGGDIWAETRTASGAINGNPMVVHGNPAEGQLKPTITVLADGRFLVGWENIGAGAFESIRAQIVDGRFTPVTVNGTAGNDYYIGSKQSGDILRGEGGNDTLLGGDGDDTLMGGSGEGDRLIGEAGSDRLYSGAGADTLMGGLQDGSNDAGYDVVSYENAAGAIVLNLDTKQHEGEAQGDQFHSIDSYAGSRFGDRMTGSTGSDAFYGDAQNDTLIGGNGDDFLIGEAGDDLMYAGEGKDALWGEWQGPDRDPTSDGWNTASYEDVTSGAIVINLDKKKHEGAAEGDTFVDIDAFVATAFNDTMIGSGGSDAFYGGVGNDSLEGGAERDFLFGQAGNDVLTGGAGNDELDGGEGINTAVFSGQRSDYTITNKGGGKATVTSTAEGTDQLTNVRVLKFAGGAEVVVNAAPTGLLLSSSSTVENAPLGAVVGDLAATDADGDTVIYSLAAGSSNAFAIRGNSLVVAGPLDFERQPTHAVTILASDGYGGSASLSVTVTVGNEMETTPFTLRGTARADVLAGENGHDTIYGSGGNDQLTGRGGKDVFVFDTRTNKRTNVDKIADFRYQDDSVYLDNKVFTQLGAGTFSKPKKFKADMFVQNAKAQDAEDRIVYDKRTGKLYYDEDGTGSKAQVQIATLTNKVKLTYQDFFVI